MTRGARRRIAAGQQRSIAILIARLADLYPSKRESQGGEPHG